MADSMKLKIVAPERIFYEGDSSFLEFTTTEGDMGIYPNHIPLTAIIAPGILRIHEKDTVKEAKIDVRIYSDSSRFCDHSGGKCGMARRD